jgi:hypothetical protein
MTWLLHVLYTPGTIPVGLGEVVNLEELYLNNNQLTGIPSLYPLTRLQN